MGEFWEERATDFDEALARNRYRVFKEQTYDALVSLKEIFHYHFINAQAPLEIVRRNIVRELEYQSSLELEPRTYDLLRRLPLASEIVRAARQELVNRLDSYASEHAAIFQRVIEFINVKAMPIVMRHAISGRADINSEDPVFDDPVALAMLIDVFSERGFHATVDVQRQEIPYWMDMQTGEIHVAATRRFFVSVFGSGDRRFGGGEELISNGKNGEMEGEFW